ncbi:MAG: SAM-dependent methyltransferase [Clostridia bacterium]|nr:SAM-dependent methyltransferase [Clostridia bacterium]
MKLSPRLQMVADLVREGVTVADIGTDHAYVPAYLVACGKCPAAVASDLREGPLMNAVTALALYGVTEQVSLRLSDGLDAYSPADADDFIFAGMGGTLIVELLSRTDWIFDSGKRFIFQPMTHAELVRAYLLQNGFHILAEHACFDECRPYVAFSAAYDPAYRPHYRKSYIWMGELPQAMNEAASYYLTKQYIYLKKRADALERAAMLPDEVRTIREILPDLLPYVRLK